MSADSQGRADELKQQGNTAFKGDHLGQGWQPGLHPVGSVVSAVAHGVARCPFLAEKHYALAQQFYTKALDEDPANPQLWANRAFAAIRLEASGQSAGQLQAAVQCSQLHGSSRLPCLSAAVPLPCASASQLPATGPACLRLARVPRVVKLRCLAPSPAGVWVCHS